MSILTSNFAFDDGVQGRYLLWTFPIVLENFPGVPDNLWRFIKYGSITFSKTSAVAISEFALDIIREPLAPTAEEIWLRRFDVGMNTLSPADLEGGEFYAANSTFWLPSSIFVGNGILLPPQAQMRALRTNLGGTTAFARIFILETTDVDRLKPYF